MKNQIYILFIVCLSSCLGVALQAQVLEPPPSALSPVDSPNTKRIKILNADQLSYAQAGDSSIQKLIGNVKLKQDSTLFYCDSAYLFESINRFEAFSKVRMEMSDSVTMTGERLEYDGETRIANVFDDIVLSDQVSTLFTQHITYYRNEDYGYYDTGGQLEDGESTLTSDFGYFYPNQDQAYFRGNVRLVNPDYQLETDTLQYNTDTKVATFITETLITSEDGEITTSRGNYDTKNNKVNLYERSQVQDSTYTLTADTLYYTDDGDLGIANGDVVVIQEDSTLEIRGQRGRFNRQTDLSLLTDEPIAIQKFEDDTLYIIADTLLSFKEKRLVEVIEASPPVIDSIFGGPDSNSTAEAYTFFLGEDTNVVAEVLPKTILADSLPPYAPDSVTANPLADTTQLDSLPTYLTDSLISLGNVLDSGSIKLVDSLSSNNSSRDSIQVDTVESRVFRAYYNMTLYMNQMQGLADSLIYLYEDSIIKMYGNPVLWAEAGQLTGDTIKIFLANDQIDSMWVGPNAFLISEAEGAGYNQVKGKELRASFLDNELNRLQIIGNAESIYFIEQEDEDTTQIAYQGMNKALSQRMTLFFVDNEVEKILFQAQPEGSFQPYYEVANQANTLEGFIWRETEKPLKPEIEFEPTPLLTSNSGEPPSPQSPTIAE